MADQFEYSLSVTGSQGFVQGPNVAHEINRNSASSATAQHFPAGIGSGATNPGSHKDHLGPFTGMWKTISEWTPGTEASRAADSVHVEVLRSLHCVRGQTRHLRCSGVQCMPQNLLCCRQTRLQRRQQQARLAGVAVSHQSTSKHFNSYRQYTSTSSCRVVISALYSRENCPTAGSGATYPYSLSRSLTRMPWLVVTQHCFMTAARKKFTFEGSEVKLA